MYIVHQMTARGLGRRDYLFRRGGHELPLKELFESAVLFQQTNDPGAQFLIDVDRCKTVPGADSCPFEGREGEGCSEPASFSLAA
jgi:hypothetical protein